MYCLSYTVHKNPPAFREHNTVFQSMDQVKGMISGDLYFLLYNFGLEITTVKKKKLKKIHQWEKKIHRHQARYSRMQTMIPKAMT